MKHLAILTLHFSLLTLHSSAAVPLRWTVETSRAQPATFEAYQGETLTFEASLQSAGKPLELSGIAALYWQTNGMGSAYWETTAAVNSNRLSAVWTPEMDVGARVYNCFIGIPGSIYHAAFQLRLRPSPGAEPNTLPLPVPVIDFAKVRVLNPPWGSGGGGVDTNAVRDIIRDEITPMTNSLYTTLNGSIDVKRDKDDLAVYEVVRTENTDWTLTTNVVDRLATTNGVNAAMTNRYTKSETDAKLAGKLDSRAAERGSIRWNVSQDDTANLNVSAISANFDGEIFVAGDSAFNGRVSCTYGWEGFESNGEILPVYLDSLEWRTTGNRSLADYGITDATPLSMISATDQTFSNAVSTVAKTVTPPPSPTLRLFDDVRQCYWIGRMVNGVINWEVE